jgi:membrane-associated phospholipid phosphatase
MMRRGVIVELDVPNRQNRTGVLLVSLGTIAIGGFLMYQIGVTSVPLMVSIMLSYWVNTVCLLIVNLFWKISIHLIGMAGVWATLLFVVQMPNAGLGIIQGLWVYPMLVFIPLLMWARVRLNAHTPAQVVAGALGGFVSQYGVLYIVFNLALFS